MVPSMNHNLSLVLLVWILLLEPSSEGGNEVFADSPMLEVLQAEALDTITLDRAVHFTTPQATGVVEEAGVYRLRVSEPSAIKFMGLKNKTTAVVDALNINHQIEISKPVALYVKDDQQYPHLVLLLPGGKGFEAVGSYDAIRSRDLRPQVTASQIQRALKEKRNKR